MGKIGSFDQTGKLHQRRVSCTHDHQLTINEFDLVFELQLWEGLYFPDVESIKLKI
jgi:hypothetical protein